MSGMIKDLFGVNKPVIAMAHLPALPGTPRYNNKTGVEGIVEHVRQDVRALVEGGVDAVLFCNEDDRPYSFQSNFESVAVLARVVSELRPTDRPYGVDFLWEPTAPLAVAKATGASFIREVITGVYESDMGLWQPDAAALYRYRRQIDADSIKIFANITPEFASPLGNRSIYQRAKSAVTSTLVDAILITGPMAGTEPDIAALQKAKDAVGDSTPVFLNTGARVDNIQAFLSVADAVIVGSSLKVDGHTWNPVEASRVKAFMKAVKEVRS